MPPRFKLLYLPDLVFQEVLKVISVPGLVALTLTSNSVLKKVAHNMGPLTRPLRIEFPGPLLQINIGNDEELTIHFVPFHPPLAVSQEKFDAGGPPMVFDENVWTVLYDSNKDVLKIAFKFFFESNAFQWRPAVFTNCRWLTFEYMCILFRCQGLEISNSLLRDEDLNEFLKTWQRDNGRIRELLFERTCRWRMMIRPIRFATVIAELVTKHHNIPMDDREMFGVQDGEYVSIQSAQPPRKAFLYRKRDVIVFKVPPRDNQ